MSQPYNKITNPGKIENQTFASNAQAVKMADAGLDFAPLGALALAVRVGPSAPIMLWNSGASVAFVKFGAQGVIAPTGPADGLPVPPNTIVIYNSGTSQWVIASSASVFGYTASNQ